MKVSRARVCAIATVLVVLAGVPACGHATNPITAPSVEPQGPFAPVTRLVNDAVAAPRLPGAVVHIGHAGKVVFRQAFGWRKLPDEPGLDGSPAPAEPMSDDTIFDLASLTKPLATSVALLQLYEKSLVRIDEPVQTYLPD
ncbi:MAG: serine hydrolase domain-containing protein, partial [[Mycobacterium] stephanolepidis]